MNALLMKELRLVVHPSTYALVILGALVLIPTWMYGAIFIYGVLVAFFNGMNAREMRDLTYTFALPASRRSMVRARILVMVLIETAMLGIIAAFVALREPLGINGIAAAHTSVGTAANLYLIGCGCALFGVFNAMFYPLYYRDPSKVGVPFLVASIPTACGIVLTEALPYLPVPGLAAWGAAGFHGLEAQLCVLGGGIAIFAVGSCLAIWGASRAFARYDG